MSQVLETNTKNGRDNKEKQKKDDSSESHDDMLKLNRTTCYRSNLRTTINELNDLEFEDSHINQIRKTPFWFLSRAIYKGDVEKLWKITNKHEENIREIMLAFDNDTNKFVVGRETISVTSRDVQLIFGLVSGPKFIPLKNSSYEVVPLIKKRCFRKEIERAKGNFVLYKRLIYQKLKNVVEKDDEISCVDVARLTHIYFMFVLLAPNQNSSIAPHLPGYLENLGTVCNYDWCTYIVDMLVSQIKYTKTLNAGGCMFLLAYWLCEHTKLVKPINEVGFPRFLKWDLDHLQKAVRGVKITGLDTNLVGSHKLKATPREQEHF